MKEETAFNKYFRFARRLGDEHLAKGSKTLCGMPMLSSNYSTHRIDLVLCEKCKEVALIKEGKIKCTQ